jgi:hypothetical protein
MGKYPSLVANLVVAILALSITTDAAQPTFFWAEVDRTAVSPFFTAACGFEVSVTQIGTVKASVFTDQTGTIISEIDTQPGFVVTYSSGESGKELSFPFSTIFHYEFPNGTDPGAPVVVTATGLIDKVPGLAADSGVVIYGNATLLFVDNGVPIVDYGAPTAFVGHANDLSAIVTAGCAALAP